ncbi:hypothetical protein [Microbacterium sp.]|uniref:hypothetical protein n=1 Tax=Microbacterium sp. TaxID=51671 RepID=UPI003C76EE15
MRDLRAVALLLAGAAVLAMSACTADPVAPASPSVAHEGADAAVSAPDWARLDDFPLEPRDGAVTAWTGSELIVVGGAFHPPCPPTADCVMDGRLARDGAAYDPASDTWRVLPPPPLTPGLTSGAYADGVLVVPARPDGPTTDVLLYDVSADTWSILESPTDRLGMPVADGDRVIFASGSDEWGAVPDRVLDVETRAWSELPEDPIGPAFDRTLTATAHGIVLTAKELVPSPGAEKPSFVLAALLDRTTGEWTRLPDTQQIGGRQWAVHGDRLIDPQLGGADGGQVGNWGREYPFGGAVTLPDGRWSELANPPPGSGWVQDTAGSRFSVSSGFVYDDEDGTWTPIGQPEDALAEAGPAVWADGQLLVVGGTSWEGITGTRSAAVWSYTPTGR